MFLGLVLASLPIYQNELVEEEEGYFLPAYSYSDNYSNEPKYKDGIVTSYGTFTQKDVTYDRMNVGSTWDSYRGEHIKVAVIDTGCNTTYEDFSGTNISSKSYDVYNKTTSVIDTSGHGTDSAACIAAAINGVGGLGVSPNVELHIYKAVNSSNAFPNSALTAALRRAIDDHVDIINMSIQGYTSSFSYSYVEDLDGKTYSGTMSASGLYKTTLQSYIDEAYNAGITVVAAAGNYNTTNTSYPAANDHVIGVGSTGLNDGDAKAGYSNYGDYVDVCAPGYVVVPSTSDAKYRLYYGTSFSAPLVTGAIALYKSKYPSATPDQIEARLKATCDSLSYSGSGSGKINVANFLDDGTAEEWVSATKMELPSTLSVSEGETVKISPTFTPTNASRQTCYYSSNATSIATVDQQGNIKGIADGTATITATSVDGGYVDTCEVTVGSYIPVTEISFSKSSLELNVGEAETLVTTIVPDNATDKYVAYISNDEKVATVDDNGKVTAIGVGSTTIGALSNDGPEATCTVTVSDSRTWNIVKNAANLADGDSIILALGSKSSSLGEFNSPYFKNVSTTFSSDYSTLTPGSTTMVITLKKNGEYWNFINNSKYIGSSAAKTMTYGTSTTVCNDWSISIDSSGSATIMSSEKANGKIMYNQNNNSPRYCTYTSSVSTSMILPIIYKLGVPTPLVLDSITVSDPQTEYTVGDSFVKPTVTATYTNGGTSTVTNATFSGYDLSTPGTQTVTVSYTENEVTKTTSYQITVSALPVVLNSISVKTNPTKLEYKVGEYFDPTGLVITKHMSDDSTSDVKYADESANFAFSPSLTTALSLSQASITITYGEKTTTIAITVKQGEIETGNMIVTQTNFSAISGNLNSDTNISYSSNKGNAGTNPGIYNNSIRLYQGSSTKYGGYIQLTAKNNCVIKSIVFVVSSKYSTTYSYGSSLSSLTSGGSIAESGTATITPVNASTFYIVNTGTTSSNRLEINSITVNYYSPLKAAQDWSDSFMSGVKCDEAGVTPPSVSEWNLCSETYDKLDSTAKSYFTATSITDTKVLSAVNKYDYIIGKYGSSTYSNFMSRSEPSLVSYNNFANLNDDNSIVIILIISIASFTLIMGYVILKIRKDVND